MRATSASYGSIKRSNSACASRYYPESINRPEVLGATCILYGVQGVLRPQAAHHGDTAIRGVDNRLEQLRPFAVVKVRSFAHRGRDLEHRLSGTQALLYPPIGKLGHRRGVQRVGSVECGW
jgi:hypothetical protein